MTLKDILIRDEGLNLKAYKDTVGKLTIGCGRNLDDIGISVDEAMSMLESDIAKATRQADAAFPWFKTLSEIRQWVVLSMIFNMGISKFLDFRGMIAAIQKQDFGRAADEMMNSLWATQVKGRAERLSKMMREDKLP